MAQTGAVLKSTGGAAGVTATQITKLADSIEKKSMLDAEAIQSGQNLLLTFTNIKNGVGKGNDVFNQTTQIMADMATAMGSDPKSSAIQLGKALNDPIKGVSALSKVGVSFTEGQKNVIKSLVESGDTMGAQKVILKELNKEFGGSAKAAGETTAGQFKHFKDMVDGAFESIVKTAIPVLLKLANFLTTNMPKALQAAQPYVDKLKSVFASLTPVFTTVFDFLRNNKTVVAAFAGTILLIVGAFTALNAVMAINPISIVVIALAALVGGLVYAYKNVEGFRNVVNQAWAAIKAATLNALPQIQATVQSVMANIRSIITSVVKIITVIWRVFGDDLKGYAQRALSAVMLVIRGGLKVIQGIFKTVSSVLKGDWSGAWDGIKQIVSGAFSIIKGLVKQGTNAAVTVMSLAWTALKTVASKAFEALKGVVEDKLRDVVTKVRNIKDAISGAMSGLGSLLYNAGAEIIQGLINGIESKINAVKDKLKTLTNLIPKVKGPMSRDKVLLKKNGQAIIQSLIDGFAASEDGVTKFLEGLTKRLETHFDKAYKSAAKAMKAQMKAAGKGPEKIKEALDKLEKKYDNMPAKVLKRYKEQTKALEDQGKAITANSAKLADAQNTLASMVQTARDYATGVRNAFAEFGNVTAVDMDEAVDANGVIKALEVRLNKAQQFAANVQSLIDMNVNETTLQQIIAAGVDGGFAVARALAAGGTGAVDQVNTIQAQLQTAGQTLGNSASSTLYDAGIQAAQGLVAGLQSQQNILEETARNMAAAMTKAIKKKLKIKSPSRVFTEIGDYTTQGLVKGLSDTAAIENAASKMSNAVVSGYASPTLSASSTSAGSASNGSGGNVYITINAPNGNGKQLMKEIDDYLSNSGKRVQITAA